MPIEITEQEIADIRLLITDTEAPPAQMFTDPQIGRFYAMEGDIRKASALALETVATNEALVLKRIKILDLSTDGVAVAEALMKRATELRKQADAGKSGFDYYGWKR